jgi:hypothetical protein
MSVKCSSYPVITGLTTGPISEDTVTKAIGLTEMSKLGRHREKTYLATDVFGNMSLTLPPVIVRKAEPKNAAMNRKARKTPIKGPYINDTPNIC